MNVFDSTKLHLVDYFFSAKMFNQLYFRYNFLKTFLRLVL